MNVIDLFCGCGGLSYGFETAGCNVLLGIDNDSSALNTFRKNHRGSKTIEGDITNISHSDIKKVIGDTKIDIIVGGPPCQGMSLSGPRKFEDPRNRLYLSFIRLVGEIKPTAFVIENVPGLVGLFRGKIKDHILESFTGLGYDVQYKILNASDFGVPQSRRRVFFVGILSHTFMFPKESRQKITCESAISDLPSLESENDQEVMEYENAPLNDYQKVMRYKSEKIHNHIVTKHNEATKKIISLVPDGGNYKDLPPEYINTRKFNVAWTRFSKDAPAPTIDTGHRHHFHYKYDRVPTVRECARIQSFPDIFIFTGNKTEQYRQVGNAVPPILAETIARALLERMGSRNVQGA